MPFLSTVNLKIGHDLDFMLHQVYNKNKIILGTFFKQVMTVIHLQNEKKKKLSVRCMKMYSHTCSVGMT